MLKSMTGYGRGSTSSDKGNVTVEIKGVNHRFRDISIKKPAVFAPVEKRIKKEIESFVSRGRIDLFLNFEAAEAAENSLSLDMSMASNYHALLKKMKTDLYINGDITVSDMLTCSGIIKASELEFEEEALWEMVSPPLKTALTSLDEMKAIEGDTLSADIRKRLDAITGIADKIALLQPEMVKKYHEQLKKKISDLSEGIDIDSARLAQETAVMAEKSDITEEIVRLKSHISQFHELLKSDCPVGRKLDFLVQEMHRETNTIASKSCDYEISNHTIDIKAETERIKEQVQNIE